MQALSPEVRGEGGIASTFQSQKVDKAGVHWLRKNHKTGSFRSEAKCTLSHLSPLASFNQAPSALLPAGSRVKAVEEFREDDCDGR